ncbi:hypothetical protein [Streptomyces cyaneofuscatus]|uniref:hypothetical protein n=1 Tax=Streptomyces cyaneofuscatus TaxID=66883 RepID=UPI003657C528
MAAAILSDRGEIARERPLPGLLARLDEETRNRIIHTEYFTRITPGPDRGDAHLLTR